MEQWLNLIELYEYKVLDLQEGRAPKGGMRSILMLRDGLLSAPLEGINIRRFRRMDRLFKSLRAAGVTALGSEAEVAPVESSRPRSSVPAPEQTESSFANDQPNLTPSDDDAEIHQLRKLADQVWRASLQDEIAILAERLRREPNKITLRAVCALLTNFESYTKDNVGKNDTTLMRFRPQIHVPTLEEPRFAADDPELAISLIRNMMDTVLGLQNQHFELGSQERLPYLRRMSALIAERPFVGRPSTFKGFSSVEILNTIESTKREQMGNSAKSEQLARLQNQYDQALKMEAQEKRDLEAEQGALRSSFTTFFDQLKTMLPDAYGGTAGSLIINEQVLFAEHTSRRIQGEPQTQSHLTVHLVRRGGAQIGELYLAWQPREGGGWCLEVGGAEYFLPDDEQLKVPVDQFEVKAFRSADYMYLEVSEGTGEGLVDQLKLARATAALLESGSEFFNLRLARGVAAWVRDGRVDLASVAPQSAAKYHKVALDTLFTFARKGAESLINRFKQLPFELIEDSFGEVARMMGEKTAKERAKHVMRFFQEIYQGQGELEAITSNVIGKQNEVVMLAYRGEPLTIEMLGRILTVRTDYKNDLTVVVVGQPSEVIPDILAYPVGDGFALLARQGLRVAVSYHETQP
jgi:hypothetical protein